MKTRGEGKGKKPRDVVVKVYSGKHNCVLAMIHSLDKKRTRIEYRIPLEALITEIEITTIEA